MCLFIDRKIGETSDVKVHCYKLLIKSPVEGYITPYQRKRVLFGEDKATLTCSDQLKIVANRHSNGSVEEGIHSYATKQRAESMARSVYDRGNVVICKAYIPADVMFIRGINDELVSRQLVILKPTERKKVVKKKAVKKKPIKKAKNASNTNTRSRNARKRKK